jgi:hypothetical protein
LFYYFTIFLLYKFWDVTLCALKGSGHVCVHEVRPVWLRTSR